MAGLVAARGRGTSTGALGVAPGSVVLPIKIPDQRSSSVADAIEQALARGARVICLALTTSDDRELETAVARARAADIVVVAGAGNYPNVGVQVPASYPGVVAVVGVDRNGNHANVSVSGSEAMLAAPAVDVVSTEAAGGYSKATGTSPATAIIAGVAALVRSKFPELNATEVIHRMTATAIDKGDPGRDNDYGFGIVNPVAALTADVPPLAANSPRSPTPSPAKALSESNRPVNNGRGPVIGVLVVLVGLLALLMGAIVLRRRATR